MLSKTLDKVPVVFHILSLAMVQADVDLVIWGAVVMPNGKIDVSMALGERTDFFKVNTSITSRIRHVFLTEFQIPIHFTTIVVFRRSSMFHQYYAMVPDIPSNTIMCINCGDVHVMLSDQPMGTTAVMDSSLEGLSLSVGHQETTRVPVKKSKYGVRETASCMRGYG